MGKTKMTTEQDLRKEKNFEEYSKKEQEQIKELVIARIKQSFPDNLRLSIG